MFRQISVLALILFQYILLSSAANPWEPVERNVARHQKFLNETKSMGSSIKLIFYGDSITEGWEWASQSIWNQHYGSMHAVNYGIGGDITQHVIWRINNGEVDGLTPKVVVLMIGTNNLYNGVKPEDIAKGIKTIIDLLHTKTKTNVLLLGILPRGDRDLNTAHVIKSINTLIAKYDNGNSVRFLDMWDKFVGSTINTVKTHLYLDDKLHLNPEGYKVWGATMDGLLKQMMG